MSDAETTDRNDDRPTMTDAETIAETLERLEECGIDPAGGFADDGSRDVVEFLSSASTETPEPPRALVELGKVVDGAVEAMERCGASRAECEDVRSAYGDLVAGMGGADAGRMRAAVADALRRCAFSLQLNAVEHHDGGAGGDATMATATATASATVGTVSGRDAMEVDEISERATRALERLAAAAAGGAEAAGRAGNGCGGAAGVLEAAAARATRALEVLPSNHTHKVLDATSWTPAQSELIESVERALHDEYKARREMVAKRAQVTTTSFCYSARLNSLKDVREDFARRVVSELHAAPTVTMDDVRDARFADLAMAGIKVNAGSAGLQSAVKKVLMGAVPDRGGRTDGNDRANAPMPKFTERVAEPSGGGGGRGGGRGGGGRSQKEKKKGCVRW